MTSKDREMNLSEEQTQAFFDRIDQLHPGLEPKFGKMNVHQMVCHCTDFFRMAKGIKRAEEYGVADPSEIIGLTRSGKTAPTPKGFGQVEGGGTLPTDLENDKKMLKEYLLDFSRLKDYDFAEHPYFGVMDNRQWVDLAVWHLNNHLKQFRV